MGLLGEECVHLRGGNFLLVQRAQYQERRARVFERHHRVEVVAERAGADDQRIRQPHAEVRSTEIHHSSFPSRRSPSSPFECPSARMTGTVIPASCWYTAYRRSAAACESLTNALYCAGFARSTLRKRDS